MDDKKNYNLTIFCDQIRNMKGKMANYMIQDICQGQVEDPSDHWAWMIYSTFGLVEEFLEDCGLWQPSYFRDLIKK